MEKLIKVGLFLINPFVGLFTFLNDLRSRSSLVGIYLFIILFGAAFTVPSGRTADFTGDGAVYRLRFDKAAELSTSEFIESYTAYFEFNEGEKDFFATALGFVVSRFTDNYHWLFAVYAAIFGFFMIKSFHIFLVQRNFKNSTYFLILAFIFMMSNSFVNINGVRFWTAAWVGVYSMLQIFVRGKPKYYVLAAITPLIHVSFFVFILILGVARFSKRYNNFWFVMFVISFFISNLSKDLLSGLQAYLPSFISKTVDLYTDEGIAAQIKEGTVWYATLFSYLKVLVLNATMFIFYTKRDIIIKSPSVYNLYLLLMVFMTFVNFTIAIPSLGGRFLMVALPLVMYVWVETLNVRYFNWAIIFLLAFSLDFAGQFSLLLKVTEIEFYLYSPIIFVYRNLFT